MKSSIAFIVLFFALSLLACQDSRDDFKNPPGEISSFRSIGEQIPLETGKRWMETYQAKSRTDGRLLFSDYSVAASKLQELLQSVPELTGVAFHYGFDENGIQHIIIIPVDETLTLWATIPGRIIVDANTGNELTQEVASTWADNYKASHPGDIWFHFFGADIFEEISAIPYFNMLDIEPALSDLLLPQMLLIVWNTESILSGRTAKEDGVVYDASSPCPPCPIQ